MLAGAARGQETSLGSRLGARSGAQQTALEGPAVPGQRFGEIRREERRGGEMLSERKAPAVCPFGGYRTESFLYLLRGGTGTPDSS